MLNAMMTRCIVTVLLLAIPALAAASPPAATRPATRSAERDTVFDDGLVMTSVEQTIPPAGKGLTRRSTSTHKIKGSKARYDSSPAMSTINDAKTGEIITLFHDTKIYSRM